MPAAADDEPAAAYAALVAAARTDPRVAGIVLSGSRGRAGVATERSDHDVHLITHERLPADDPIYRSIPGQIDLIPWTLEAFRAFALAEEPEGWERYMEWRRYAFAHVTVELDTLDGEIGRLVAAKGTLTPEVARRWAEEALDGYVNFYYRSLKNDRDSRETASHLDAAESISHMLWALFAFFGRVRPYNKFLEWELREHPLPGGDWTAERLLPRIRSIVATGDVDEQRRLYRDVERLAADLGYGHVIAAWGDDLRLIRGEVDIG